MPLKSAKPVLCRLFCPESKMGEAQSKTPFWGPGFFVKHPPRQFPSKMHIDTLQRVYWGGKTAVQFKCYFTFWRLKLSCVRFIEKGPPKQGCFRFPGEHKKRSEHPTNVHSLGISPHHSANTHKADAFEHLERLGPHFLGTSATK